MNTFFPGRETKLQKRFNRGFWKRYSRVWRLRCWLAFLEMTSIFVVWDLSHILINCFSPKFFFPEAGSSCQSRFYSYTNIHEMVWKRNTKPRTGQQVRLQSSFLGAPTHLYNRLCPLVGRSVSRSACLSGTISLRPWELAKFTMNQLNHCSFRDRAKNQVHQSAHQSLKTRQARPGPS